MSISIIIPTRNRAKILKKTLEKFVKIGGFFELIIVDGASQDETFEVVENLRKSHSDIRIKYHRSKEREGSPKASNVGIKLADGNFLTWFGDDMIVKNGELFKIIVEDFKNNPKVGVIGGKRIEVMEPTVDPSFYVKYGDILTRLTGFIFLDIFTDIRMATFVCAPIVVRREIGQGIKYDENYEGTAYREESDFTQQAKQKGWKCLFEPKFKVYHFGQNKGGNRGQMYETRMYWKSRNHTYYLLKNFNNNKLLLFWYILCGLVILFSYKPRFLRYILVGFKDGMRLFFNTKFGNKI